MKSLVQWLFRRQRSRSSAVLLVDTKKLLTKFSWVQVNEKTWRASTGMASGEYPLSLQLRNHGDYVTCSVSAAIIIDRVWFEREMALRLLESSHEHPYGTYSLRDCGDGMREIVYFELVDPKRYTPNDVAWISLKMLSQFQTKLCELYACDLILPRFLTDHENATNKANKHPKG